MFVLRRYDRFPEINMIFVSYEETTNTFVTEYNGKKATTLFLKTESARSVALNKGWKDETEEYNKHLQKEQEIVDSEKLSKKQTTISKKANSPKKKTKTSKQPSRKKKK